VVHAAILGTSTEGMILLGALCARHFGCTNGYAKIPPEVQLGAIQAYVLIFIA
jgi:hypothetical protein